MSWLNLDNLIKNILKPAYKPIVFGGWTQWRLRWIEKDTSIFNLFISGNTYKRVGKPRKNKLWCEWYRFKILAAGRFRNTRSEELLSQKGLVGANAKINLVIPKQGSSPWTDRNIL